MRQTRVLGIAVFVAVAADALIVDEARAHIDMFGALQSRNGNQKAAPCEGKERADGPVYTFEPGATIKLEVAETVAHPGYFRISFDDDGTDGFKDPGSINPIDPKRYEGRRCKPASEGGFPDNCGKSDFCNVVSTTGGPTVLWDNLDPHVPASFTDRKNWAWTVKLPDVECTNCTLQVQQIMEDPISETSHGPFDGKNDIYYRCVNIVLKRGVGNTPGTVTAPAAPNKGIECATATTTDAGAPAAPINGGIDAGITAIRASYGGAGTPLEDAEEVDAEAAATGCSVGSSGRASTAGAFGLLLVLGALFSRKRKRSV